MKRTNYQTAGRVALTAFLLEHPDRQFTADELYRAVNGRVSIGRSSVYRLLRELCEEQTVRSFRGAEHSSTVYQYVGEGCDCRHHFHEKCVRCGKIYHLDCGATEQFIRHLYEQHGFAVDCGGTILYGVCAACREGVSAHA